MNDPRTLMRGFAGAPVFCFLAAYMAASVPASLSAQNLRLDRARVITGTGEEWASPQLAVRGGRVLAPDTTAPAGAAAEYLGGRGYVYPGFVDAHGHLVGLGASLEQVDLVGTASFEAVVEAVRIRAAERPKGTWILGRGWDQNDWSEKRLPLHDLLSSVVPDHPVVLTRIDGHALLANYAAMQAAKIGASTEAPSGGEILRDDAGTATGVFVDRAMALVSGSVPLSTEADYERQLRAAQAKCLALGLTCVHDAGMPPAALAVLRRLHTAGRWALRVYVMLPASAEAEIRKGPWQTPDGVITVRAVKGYADGALGSRGAALLEGYADRPVSRGLMLTPEKGLKRLAQLCADHGFQLCVHAIGDRANRAVLDAYEATEHRGELADARFRIEHAQIVHPDDFNRFHKLGVLPSMQPTHLTSDMPWAPDRLGTARLPGAYAWRTFLDLGLPLAFGSDFPVERPDPLLGWYAAATTRSADGSDPEWRPEQKLTRAEILRAFTKDAAFASFAEFERGTIEPGRIADFTVLDTDLMTCDDAAIRDADVLMTVIGGRVVYRADSMGYRPRPTREEDVRKTLEYFASDELMGRDSPSPGLEQAAEFIASNFAAVGLQPMGDDGRYFHRYSLDGLRMDGTAVDLQIVAEDGSTRDLEPGRDVRVLRPGRGLDAREGECDVVAVDGPRPRRGRRTMPRLVSMPAAHPLWQRAGSERSVISRRLPGGAPTLAVREGLLEVGAKVQVRVTAPAPAPTSIPLRNVVGLYHGTDLAEEYVLITAHYDHVGSGLSGSEDVVFNGADDNATGTTAVVTLARAIAGTALGTRRSLLFVCFSAEEKGLRGSAAFVERPPVPLDKIAAVVNLEMLGRPEEGKTLEAWITGRNLSNFADIAGVALPRAGVRLGDHPMASRLFTGSDNWPFAKAGVVAHSLSAGTLHSDYHQVGDEASKIDTAHMATVIDGVREFVLELANRDARPEWTEAGRKRLKLDAKKRDEKKTDK